MGYDVGGIRSGGSQGGDLGPVGQSREVRSQDLKAIKDGQEVDGLVLRSEGSMVQVRVSGRTLWAQSSVPLFPGQRFRALWDASGEVPLLRLRQEDLELLSRFPMRDRPLAQALILRRLPADLDSLWGLRQAWMASGGAHEDLPAAVELFARGLPVTQESVKAMGWYMALAPQAALTLWKRVRERLKLKNSTKGVGSLEELFREDPEALRFLKAHRWASTPVRWSTEEPLMAPAFWPAGEDGPMARVVFSETMKGGRRAYSVFFEVEGDNLGRTEGWVAFMNNLIGVDLRADSSRGVELMRHHLGELKEDLSSGGLKVSHVSASSRRPKPSMTPRPIDMEA
ncbi:MAG: flagellar hook-length control protein FliK [Thermanaerothrix sp.]|nr:flagellar hook-length control protein FliK [Thermanaerothrix sp.]